MSFSLTRLAAGVVLVAALIAACGGNSHTSSKPSQKAKTPAATSHASGGSIPQGNGGDRDADNNGGPSDGDGNI
jgi:hypothetical protein